VIATGPFQIPKIPDFSKNLPDHIYQVHASEFHDPSQLQEGPVIVVGAGNSGAQIAVKLSKIKKTYISIGRPIKYQHTHVLGKSIFWYLDRLGIITADLHTKRGAWMKITSEEVYGYDLKHAIEKKQVLVKPRAISTIGSQLCFADATALYVPNIIWATGYRLDYSWIHIPNVLNSAGHPIHDKGISPISNLYFIGLRWLSCQGSSLLGWVGHDAKRIFEHLYKKDSIAMA
jgi:putative flavoprotein involved in K+ transport